jgi:DNA helicase-2/ATP-dependent DNA helicase PcrA
MQIEDVLRGSFPWCSAWATELRELFAIYVEAKQRHNVLDYDDLLLYWAQAVSDPTLAEEIGGRFDYILVDEYQDTNRLQSSILLALKPCGHGLMVVGDDAQAIYSFRAATVRNILDFPGRFSPAAEIITLDRNYRSTQPILARRMPLSILQPNASRRTSGRSVSQLSDRNSSAFGTRLIRLSISSDECLKIAKAAPP